MDINNILKVISRIEHLKIESKAKRTPNEEWIRETAIDEIEKLQKIYAKDLIQFQMRFRSEDDIRGHLIDRGIVNPDFINRLDKTEYTTTAAMHALKNERNVQDSGGSIFILGGGVGVGKSFALAHAVYEREGLFLDASYISAVPRNGYSDNEDKWQEWLAMNPLAIDELGTEKNAENAQMLLLLRWNLGKATIGSTNLTKEQFAERYFGTDAARFADRLRGQDEWFVTLNGESLR